MEIKKKSFRILEALKIFSFSFWPILTLLWLFLFSIFYFSCSSSSFYIHFTFVFILYIFYFYFSTFPSLYLSSLAFPSLLIPCLLLISPHFPYSYFFPIFISRLALHWISWISSSLNRPENMEMREEFLIFLNVHSLLSLLTRFESVIERNCFRQFIVWEKFKLYEICIYIFDN